MDRLLQIGPGVTVPRDEVGVEYSRASGPGGQHVNKTETRVTLRFALAASPSIPAADKLRMAEKLGPRLTKGGEILVSVSAERDRPQNLETAFERLEELLRRAFVRPKPRRRTRPSRGAKERRLADKRQTGAKKQGRQGPGRDED